MRSLLGVTIAPTLVLLLLVVNVKASFPSAPWLQETPPAAAAVPSLTYVGDSNYDFGFQIGTKFRSLITERFTTSTELKTLIAFYQTAKGKAAYDAYVDGNMAVFPAFFEELRGMSDGSGQPLSAHIISTFAQEMGYALRQSTGAAFEQVEHCSDYTVFNTDLGVVGHNEDGDKVDAGHMALITATFPNYPTWTAFVYLGDLATGAWGFNIWGLGFTMNQLSPTDFILGGLGRAFIARRLLEAKSLNEALALITMPGQAIGHNYQVMHIPTRRVLNVEVAGAAGHHARYEMNTTSPPFFHVNIYQKLNVSQIRGPSSVHRLARAAAMAVPRTVEDILTVLGDQFDRPYPIFYDGVDIADLTGGATLTTVVFDMDEWTATLFNGNPTRHDVAIQLITYKHSSEAVAAAAADLPRTTTTVARAAWKPQT